MRSGRFVHHNKPRLWVVCAALLLGVVIGSTGVLFWQEDQRRIEQDSYYQGTGTIQASGN